MNSALYFPQTTQKSKAHDDPRWAQRPFSMLLRCSNSSKRERGTITQTASTPEQRHPQTAQPARGKDSGTRMDGDTDSQQEEREWTWRARTAMAKQPRARIGAVVANGRTDVAHTRSTTGNNLSLRFSAIDVPSDGNCLYYAVWQAVRLQGVVRPLGFSGVDHVFMARVAVAMRATALLRTGQITNVSAENEGTIGGLIAQPNQYLQYSGVIPLMAMAHMLQRTIVTLSADGIVCITPHDFDAFVGQPDVHDPIAVYHCQAGGIGDAVPFSARNHYTATEFDSEGRYQLKRVVAAHRERQDQDTAQDITQDAAEALPPTKSACTARNVRATTGTRKRPSPPAVASKQANSRNTKPRSGNDGSVISSLSRRALSLTELEPEEILALASCQNFASDPRLALLYFHCCSNNPAAFVHNNEHLNGTDGGTTVERLVRTLDTKPTSTQVKICQAKAKERSGSETSISACASCCQIIRGTDAADAKCSLDDLSPTFRYTASEEARARAMPADVVRDVIQVVICDGIYYHLNPELVPDTGHIALCRPCSTNPRTVRYSIASGHDYGRSSALPPLSDIASKCISPVRCFGIELLLGGKHSTGHAICFPSDGPLQCSQILPSTDESCLPRVTFIGPMEQWRLKSKKFRRLYALPVDAIYAWLRVLQHTHSSFSDQGIVVEDTEQRREDIRRLEALIEERVTIQDGDAALRHEDRVNSERYGTDMEGANEDEVVMSGSAVLKPPCLDSTSSFRSVVETMLELLDDQPHPTRPVVPVQRGEEPIVEWARNGELIACAFPHLFMMGGKHLPPGTWSPDFLAHLMNYYDGRFENSTTLIALLFNQLQRHTAVQRAAKVGVTHTATLKRFGSLVNSPEFRAQLELAKAQPESGVSRRLNASLLRILSLVGGSVPFSPFERAATRPKIAAMRYRYGAPQHWVTLAPPEHDDLLLHRVALLRGSRLWNRESVACASGSYTFEDLPDPIRTDPRARLVVSNRYPALAVSVFETRFRSLVEDIMLSSASSNIRVSRHYAQRPCGPFGSVAAHCSVVEAQVDGRLHSHTLVYGSTFTPELLTRVSCNARLRMVTADWLEFVCTTRLSPPVREWLKSQLSSNKLPPRAFQIHLPDASEDQDGFYTAAEQRIATTNIHAHSTTCRKGLRGKYMCRLARPAGIHESDTEPLQVCRKTRGNMAKGIRPELVGHQLDEAACAAIDGGYDVDGGYLFAPRLPGPIVWELRRPPEDSMVIETNRILGALTLSHTNASVVSGEDAGDMVEQYSQAYMTKDQASLNTAIPVLLSALSHVEKHPSKADDRDTNIRKGKYLASRTINAFTGAHEWPHSIMVFALLGHRSFVSSDTFWYIFPRALVKSVANAVRGGPVADDAADEDNDDAEEFSDDSEEGSGDAAQSSVDNELDALVAMANNDSHDGPAKATGRDGGTRTFKIGNKLVFVSQVDSYVHRGVHFADYSPMEFECIVDVLPARESKSDARGRPARCGFSFARTHPLFGHYEGFIRMKMHTPIFGGAPPPLWKDTGASPASAKRDAARYVLSTFVPWSGDRPPYAFDETGLVRICKEWDHSESPLVNRQRYRYLRNVLQRGRRSSQHEATITDWRNRNTDLWKEMRDHEERPGAGPTEPTDPEMAGMLPSAVDALSFLEAMTSTDPATRTQFRAIQTTLTSILDVVVGEHQHGQNHFDRRTSTHGMLPMLYNGKLHEVAARLQAMQKDERPAAPTVSTKTTTEVSLASRSINSSGLSQRQIEAVKHVVTGIDSKCQTLTMLHGAGGTGKSFVVRRICEEIERRGMRVVSTCPTGAGACQLHNGRTFHSAFKCSRNNHVGLHAMELLKQNFDSSVALVVVDEVSMLNVGLFLLLDERLRLLYDSNRAFGGISILLVGDFAQLKVVAGVTLCKIMYCEPLNVSHTLAKNLFQKFKVLFLERQERAKGCVLQQQHLQSLRSLPAEYPMQNRWTKADSDRFRPITPEVARAITTPLTAKDARSDPMWLDTAVILVTSNRDRCAMNAAMAEMVSRKKQVLLFRWRRRIREEDSCQFGASLNMLYNEEERPTLFGYFFRGAKGQVLDNSNGNVMWGIANGTMCRYHSIAWDDDDKTNTVLKLTSEALEQGQSILELPFPPDFINVVLLDRDGNAVSPSQWPDGASLNSAASEMGGHACDQDTIVVPIGIAASKGDAFRIKFPATSTHDEISLSFEQHAVDLAMSLTIWKAQGATFDRVILHLEASTLSPPWEFEHLYVALSRVRAASHIRCLPLSFTFDKSKLLKLRPNIFTVKWRMDISPSGVWHPRNLTASANPK